METVVRLDAKDIEDLIRCNVRGIIGGKECGVKSCRLHVGEGGISATVVLVRRNEPRRK